MDYDGTVVLGTEIDTTGAKEGIKELEKMDVTGKFDKLKGIVGAIGNKMKSVIASVFGVSKAVVSLIAKLGIIGVLIGGIVLVAKIISDAFRIATEENQELQAQIQYIKFAIQSIARVLAETIGKILVWIIKKLNEILGFVGGIIKAITGKNIFEKASIKDFSNSLKKADKNSKGLSKNLKEIQKTLAGFDEINKLSGGSAGVGLLGGSADDISKYIDAGDDLATKTESWGEKIKKAFRIPTPEEIWSGTMDLYKAMWQTIDKIFKFSEIYEQLKTTFKPIVKWTNENILTPIWNDIKTTFEPLTTWFDNNVKEPAKTMFGGLWDELLSILAPYINTVIDWINNAFGIFGVNIKHVETKTDKATKEGKKDLKSVDKKIDETGNVIETNINDNLDTAKEKAIDLASESYDVKIGNTEIVDANEKMLNLLDYLKQLTGKTWKIVTNIATQGGNSLKNWYNDTLRSQLKGVGINLPRLAKGGIVNLPGNGVPVGAIAGERGSEGVIPLTDSQQMELLGQAIGRYITINLTNVTKLNARQIAKEVKNVTNESEFATNGGA